MLGLKASNFLSADPLAKGQVTKQKVLDAAG
jgi:hypothetical protein